MRKTILVIEDDKDITGLLEHYLKESYKLLVATDGVNGLNRATRQHPDLIILDLMLPEMTGLDVCGELKRSPDTALIPVIILTAKGEEMDKVVGLELGADDYITKPFSPKELVARVRALLRRYEKKGEVEKLYKYGQLTLDKEKHEVSYGNKCLDLTTKEFGLLETLLRNRGRVLTRESLLSSVWGEDYYGGSRTVDVHIRKLREKIPQLSSDIITVKGLGYKLRTK